MCGNVELFCEYLSVTASLIEHIDEVGVFKDILNFTACKQVLDVLCKSSRNTAPFSETLPDFARIRRCLLLFEKKVELVDILNYFQTSEDTIKFDNANIDLIESAIAGIKESNPSNYDALAIKHGFDKIYKE